MEELTDLASWEKKWCREVKLSSGIVLSPEDVYELQEVICAPLGAILNVHLQILDGLYQRTVIPQEVVEKLEALRDRMRTLHQKPVSPDAPGESKTPEEQGPNR